MTNDEREDEKTNENYVFHDLRKRIHQKLKYDKKQHILAIIIHYLKKSKKNYIYFDTTDTDALDVGMQINQLIFDSRKDLKLLNTTDIYQISKNANSFNIIKNQQTNNFMKQHTHNSFDELYVSYVCYKISKFSKKKIFKILEKEIGID